MVQKLFAKLLMELAVACGVGSLILFVAFPVGSYALVRVHWPLTGILLWDGLLCLAFFLQHSGMVRRGFRDRISGAVPRQYHRAVYSIASGLVLTAVVILWQPSDTHVFVIAGPFRLAAYAGVLIAIAVFIGVVALRGVDLFGLAAIKANLRGTTEAASEFVIAARIDGCATPGMLPRSYSSSVVRRFDPRQVVLQCALDWFLDLSWGKTRRRRTS